MLGSVDEWCQDRFLAYKPTETEVFVDGVSTKDVILDADMRVSRGGSFRNEASEVRSAHRAGDPAMYASTIGGFRVARTLP
jgi:formylglycine-generating enzyme required for sulfatase activity